MWLLVTLAEEFDLDQYSAANFTDAVESRRKAEDKADRRRHVFNGLFGRSGEDLSAVLYPNDATYEGRELRLRQQCARASPFMKQLPL